MNLDEILDRTADVFHFITHAKEKPYTTSRVLENEKRVMSLPTPVFCGLKPQYQ